MRLCLSRRSSTQRTAEIAVNSGNICLLRNHFAIHAKTSSANSALVNLDTIRITNALLVSKKIKKTLRIWNSSKDKKMSRESRKKRDKLRKRYYEKQMSSNERKKLNKDGKN